MVRRLWFYAVTLVLVVFAFIGAIIQGQWGWSFAIGVSLGFVIPNFVHEYRQAVRPHA